MEQMLQALLGPKWGEWKGLLSQRLQINEDKAGPLLGGAAQQVMGLFTSGQLNLEALKKPQGVAYLLGQLDLRTLANNAGIDTAKLEGALAEVLPQLIAKAGAILGGGGALSDLLGNLNPDSK